MPRKGHVPKREVMPDPIYGDVVVTKLINNIMLDGKKGTAQAIVYGAFEIVKEKRENWNNLTVPKDFSLKKNVYILEINELTPQ